MKLNGWQRLWVIGAVILALTMALQAAKNAPTASEYRRIWKQLADTQYPAMVPTSAATADCLAKTATYAQADSV